MMLSLTTLITAIMAALAFSATPPYNALPSKPQTTSVAPALSAPSSFLVDTEKGTILYAKNPDAPFPIASITKLMTALVVLDSRPEWSKEIEVIASDIKGGSSAALFLGEQITIKDAWNLMLVSSSNDAAALLARVAYGSEEAFVKAMQSKAHALGLLRTTFADPTGLKPENSSTARETALLARLALSYPQIRDTVVQEKVVIAPQGKASRISYATDQLLRWFNIPDVRLFGGKTGHIEESKYNFAFAAGDAGHELVGVVLGSETNDARFSDMNTLLTWGFKEARVSQALGD